MEVRGLREGPRRSERQPGTDDWADGKAGRRKPRQLLPLRWGQPTAAGQRYGPAGCPAAGGVGVARLRSAADHGRTTAARVESKPQAGLPADAGRQLAVCAEAEIRGD